MEICFSLCSDPGVVEYFGTRINRNRFPKILGYFGTIPIYPAPGGRIFGNHQDISEPPSGRFHMIFWVSRRFQIRVYTLYTIYLLFIQSRLAFMSLFLWTTAVIVSPTAENGWSRRKLHSIIKSHFTCTKTYRTCVKDIILVFWHKVLFFLLAQFLYKNPKMKSQNTLEKNALSFWPTWPSRRSW